MTRMLKSMWCAAGASFQEWSIALVGMPEVWPCDAASHSLGEPGFPISRSLSTSRRRTDELGYRLERPIHFECKLNEPMHIGMRLLHPAAADHSVSINRQQVQCIFSFSLRSRAVTSFCSWLLLNEWIQRVEHALRKTLVLVVRHYSGGGSSHVEWTAHIRLHYPLFVLQMTISPVCFSMLK